MIARLACELHCYVPEELDEAWAHLRHLGRRRAQLLTAAAASAHRILDFLSVAWPRVTETCAQPLLSKTWLAAAMSQAEFTALVRTAVVAGTGGGPRGTICARIFAALTDTEGVVTACRRG